MKTLVLIISVFFTSSLLADFTSDCLNPVSPLKKGDIAQCSGYLFSKLTEAQARHSITQAKLIKEEMELLIQQNLDLKEEIVNFTQALAEEQKKSKEWKATAIKYSTKYEQAESGRATRDAMFFAGGILFTVIAGVGIVWIISNLGVSAGAAAAAGG